MLERLLILILWAGTTASASHVFTFTTLNCYWFLGEEESEHADRPRTTEEYSLKAGHLVGLLPPEAPLFVGLQEVGNDLDVQALAYAAKRRYGREYKPLFVQGRDTATRQDVGAILDLSRGWGVHGQPARSSDLEKELSKHLVVRLTNEVTSIDICVVHLRVPRNHEGKSKQVEQNRALLRWAMRHLAKDPGANLIILGDFNEGYAPGDRKQSLSVLFQAKPPMFDAFDLLNDKARTHADGKAYDRIILSDALLKGNGSLKIKAVTIQKHSHGKGEKKRLYTDHFPVSVHLEGN